jgi:hypothetical protein
MRIQTVKIRSVHCLQLLCWALLAGPGGAQGQTNTNTAPTGVAWVFQNGVMDWNTFQFKTLAPVTLHHLEQSDTNGNWVGSNNGLSTGEYAQTSIESLNQFDPSDSGMLWMNDLLCHHRRRTRNFFDSHFQGNCWVASFDPVPLNPSGAVAAIGEVAPPVMFLNAVIARGPPCSGDQVLYPFDHAPVRPARQYCAAPLLPSLPFPDSTSVNNPPGPFLQPSLESRAGLDISCLARNASRAERRSVTGFGLANAISRMPVSAPLSGHEISGLEPGRLPADFSNKYKSTV